VENSLPPILSPQRPTFSGYVGDAQVGIPAAAPSIGTVGSDISIVGVCFRNMAL